MTQLHTPETSRPLPPPSPWPAASFPPPQGPPILPPTEPTPHSGPHPRRRPGWGALVLAGLGSAVLASGLSVGVVTALDNGPATTSSTGQASADAPTAPLDVTGTDAVDWTAVAAAVSPSVVSIQVSGASGGGEGSGVVLDDQGRILTNNHVVTGAGGRASIQVTLADGRVFQDVSVVGLDPATDLAVVQIADPPADLVPATLGDSDEVTVGQPVMAVGNPLGLPDTVTTGIVSATDRPVTTAGESASPFDQGGTATEPVVTNAIQTDAAINPGNSGGALVDAAGRLIGIPSSIASTASGSGQSGSIGVGFAIPVNEAERIATELIDGGTATHAWLGVSLTDGAGTADGTTREGAVVASVTEGTPAAAAGLRADDVVVSVDGEGVSGAESLTAQIRERAPGDEATLGIVRDGSSVEVAVTLGTRPEG